MGTNLPKEKFALGIQLSGLACLSSRIVTAVRKRYGLTVFEFHTLLAVRTRHPSCIHTLGNHLESEKSRTSKVLRALETKALISRSSDVRDRRVEHVELTVTGFNLTDQILEDLETIGRALLRNAGEDDAVPFIQFLDRLGGVCITDMLLSSSRTPLHGKDTP